jgi:hypothetical protein
MVLSGLICAAWPLSIMVLSLVGDGFPVVPFIGSFTTLAEQPTIPTDPIKRYRTIVLLRLAIETHLGSLIIQVN